jgi:hypothetical protein
MNIFYGNTITQLDSLKNNQVNFVNLQANLIGSAGNIESTLFSAQRIIAPE